MFCRVGLILRGMGSETTHTPFSLPFPNILCQNFSMRKLTATLCLTIAVLLGSAGEGFGRDIAGSIWRFYEDDGDVKIILFENDKTFTFLNVVSKSGNQGKTYGDKYDTWSIDDNLVVVSFTNGYKIMSLTINSNRDRMTGTSINKKNLFERINGQLVEKGVIFENGKFLFAKKPYPTVTAEKTPTHPRMLSRKEWK